MKDKVKEIKDLVKNKKSLAISNKIGILKYHFGTSDLKNLVIINIDSPFGSIILKKRSSFIKLIPSFVINIRKCNAI